MANKIVNPAVPNLPNGPDAYLRQYQDQYSNVLRLYFNQLKNALGELFNTQGGKYLSFPYGSFYDTTTQTVVSTTTAYPVTINTSAFTSGVSITSSSRITFAIPGYYNVQFSVQLANYDNASQDVDMWFRQNGTDIAYSNSRFGLPPRKSVGDPSHLIQTVNLFVDANATDYVELVWCSSNVNTKIEAYVAGTSPTRPAVPSVIVTAQFVSALPA